MSQLTLQDKLGELKEILPWVVNPILQVAAGAFQLMRVNWKLSLVVSAMLVVQAMLTLFRAKNITARYAKVYSRRLRDVSHTFRLKLTL